MTREEREAIHERCKAAMSGPWEYDDKGGYIWQTENKGDGAMIAHIRGWGYLTGIKGLSNESVKAIQTATGEFIAHAREDILTLMNALDKMEAEKSNWIPVSERLPANKINPITSDYYTYPVTFKLPNGVPEIRYYKFGNGNWWNSGAIMDEHIIAWMELGEPYKPEGYQDVEANVLQVIIHEQIWDQCGMCETFVSYDAKTCGNCGAKLNRKRCDKFKCINLDCCQCDNQKCDELRNCRSCVYKDCCEIVEDE